MNQNRSSFARSFLQETLLYSGQFALFYLLMQLIIEGPDFVRNTNHLGLLLALVVQTLLLARYGKILVFRASLTFVVPVVYSLLEMAEGSADLLNAAHVGFWVYAVLSSALMVLKTKLKRAMIYESLLIAVNVAIFIFLYFYFDTLKEVQDKGELVVGRIFNYVPVFLSDRTHWFIIVGGALLALTIALSRNEVERLKSRIYALFGKYIDTGIRDIIIEKGGVVAEKKELCILFSDIKNFTRLCEDHSPEHITEMLNDFFDQWNGLVKQHNGTVDKYIGDAIMVIFGLQDPAGSCAAAVRCAMAMDARWEAFAAELQSKGLPVPENFGIGLHWGEVIIGDLGSSDRKNFTVVGDTVNIASRLEAETRNQNSRLLLSDAVYRQLDADHRARLVEIGDIVLKGKEQRVRTFGYVP